MPTPRPPAAASPVVAAALLVLLALGGCARDGRDWRSAQQADTQEAYDAFLAKHPASEFAPKAKERAGQFVEERDWASATTSDSPEAYQSFIGRHPRGKWTQEARIRVENFYVMAATAPEVPAASAASAQTTAAVAASVSPPAARPAATAAPGAPPDAVAGAAGNAGEHRVQLGAFSSLENAEAEWTRVRERFAALQSLDPRITAVQTEARRLFRLQATLPDAAAAKALCEKLKADGQACLYVPPK